MTPPGWGKTMSEDKEALSEESLEKAIVSIRAHIAEMGEVTNPKPTKLLLQPGLLKELGLTVKDVVKMIEEHTREHIDSETCWCEPELDYTDPDTGVSVYVHRRVQ
jgi:hypothetical protein